jgi:glycine/D-amino acid oxidase-like deaminating enzyme
MMIYIGEVRRRRQAEEAARIESQGRQWRVCEPVGEVECAAVVD